MIRYKESYATFHIPCISGARPANGISIEFEIRSKYAVLWFKTCSSDHNEILYMAVLLS